MATTRRTPNKTPRYISDRAATAALVEALKELPEEWLVCRANNHALVIAEEMHVSQRKGKIIQQIEEIWSCVRCGTVRTDFFVPTENGVEKVGVKYDTPEGYLFTNLGIPRGIKPKTVVRAEQWNRVQARAARNSRRRAAS